MTRDSFIDLFLIVYALGLYVHIYEILNVIKLVCQLFEIIFIFTLHIFYILYTLCTFLVLFRVTEMFSSSIPNCYQCHGNNDNHTLTTKLEILPE